MPTTEREASCPNVPPAGTGLPSPTFALALGGLHALEPRTRWPCPQTCALWARGAMAMLPAVASLALSSKSSFLHFILSLSLSVQAGSVSVDIKFSVNLLASHAIHGDSSHKTRESSPGFSQITTSLFLASAQMVDWIHESHA